MPQCTKHTFAFITSVSFPLVGESDSHVQIPGMEKLAPSPDERTSEAMRQRTSDMHLKEGVYGHLETDFDRISNSRNS